MNEQHDDMVASLNRLVALFTWWGVPGESGTSAAGAHLKQTQAFASSLQQAYGEACSDQTKVLLATNERIAKALMEFLRCRQPQDAIAAQASLLSAVADGMSQQAKSWNELAQKIQGCCAAATREMARDMRTHPAGSGPARSSEENKKLVRV